MKFRLFALLALVLGVVSCQKDPYGLEVDSKGEAAVTLNVALPDDATRAAGNDSAKGGVYNVDMSEYDIRYILEVYDENGVLAKERMAHTTDATTTSFSFRLVPGRAYNFVVWADFVLEGSGTADYHYDTSAGLDEVKVKMANWTVIDESRDAYTDVATVHNFSSTADIPSITLTRPFAKLRVVTNDIKEMISVRPAVVKVNYFSTEFFDTFNALSETASGSVAAPQDLTVTLLDSQKNLDEVYSEGMDAEAGKMTLFADYFFGAKDNRVMFTMDVKDNGGKDLPRVTFNTNIPVQRNNLTTVYGPVLTDANNITVTIDPDFDNGSDWDPEDDKYDVAVWDGQSTNEPAYDPATKTYTIKNGDELAWLADQVNGVTRAASNAFSGYNFVLAKDINLGDNEWTPIGGSGKYFAGTFDGKNYTVSNFQVTKQEGHAALFGNARATIKNLNVENVKIVSHHYAGAIVGQGYSKIDGCHVDNIDITLTTKDGDWGDKAGGIIGQNCEGAGMYVKNSTAKNVTIKGYRDLGGIAGMAHNNNTVSVCRVENITILQDLSVNYEDNTPTTLGAVIGRKGSNVIDENNTVGEGIEIAVLAANLEQLQAALDAAKAGQTNIHIVADIVADITVTQKDGVHITIDGKENKYNGTITVSGQSSTVNDKSLTIKNVKFETEESNLAFIASTTDDVRYARNITIEDCTFKGSGDTSDVVALKLRQAYDIEVNNCKATDLHSFGQITSSNNMSFTKLIVTSGRGLNFQTAAHGTVVFNECNITATKYDGYGIRVDRYAGNSLTVNNSTISAFEPVVLRGTATTFTLNLNKSTLTATGNGTKNIVFTEPADIFIDGEEVINTAEKLVAAIEDAKAGDTITIEGDITLTENVTIPAGVTFNGNGKQINGTLIAGGDIAFAGHTKVTAFSAGFSGYEITIGEGACLEITGGGRSTMGYNNTFNITGTITDAKSADKANIQPSLIIPAGISITGGNGLELNIKDAYVQIASTTSKNSAANGTFTINIENSIAEFTNQLTFSEPTSGKNPTFNLNVKNSVLTTEAKLILAAKNCNMVVDNSTIDVKTYFRNSGNVELKNGSVLTGRTIDFGENGGHDGKTTVDASKFTIINASSTSYAYDGRGTGSITIKNGAKVSVDYYKDLTINCDASSTFTGTKVN